MVNGPEVWTRPGWMMNWWWIDSWMAVFHCFTCLLYAVWVLRKNSGKFPPFYFSENNPKCRYSPRICTEAHLIKFFADVKHTTFHWVLTLSHITLLTVALRSLVVNLKRDLCIGTTVFRGKFFQIPRLNMANLPHIVINFLRPLNPTKYAVFVAGNCNWQLQSVYQINWQYFR